jgi:hypothetical protein
MKGIHEETKIWLEAKFQKKKFKKTLKWNALRGSGHQASKAKLAHQPALGQDRPFRDY